MEQLRQFCHKSASCFEVHHFFLLFIFHLLSCFLALRRDAVFLVNFISSQVQ